VSRSKEGIPDMATRSIARLFETSAAAHAAVRDLEAAGFGSDDISYLGGDGATVANDAPGTVRDTTGTGLDPDRTTRGDTGSGTGAATGATLGTVLGGGAGLLAGIGSLAIPGLGPIVAAGWLIATLTGAGAGAAAGGLLGGLAGAGFGEEHASTYAEGVRRGGHLVVVRAEETRAMEAELILDRHNPMDTDRAAEGWRAEGWRAGGTTAGTGLAGTGTVVPGAVTPGLGLDGGVTTPGLRDDIPGANDPTRRRPGDVA
jgi:hypothetical protein